MPRNPTAPPPDETPPAPDPQPAKIGRPSLPEVAAELHLAPEEIAEVYAAEVAAQRSVCHTTPWSEWLTAALILRVKTARVTGPRSGSADPEVRALEADHTKRVPAVAAAPIDRKD